MKKAIFFVPLFFLSGCSIVQEQSILSDKYAHSFRGTPACNNNMYLQKYDCSITRIQQSAADGNPDAQYALGYMYYYGIGTPKDLSAASLWIQRSATQGQPLALQANHLLTVKSYPEAGDATIDTRKGYQPKKNVSQEELHAESLNEHLPSFSVATPPVAKTPVIDSLKDDQNQDQEPTNLGTAG